jgi:PAS domain S-box-containing protein
MAARIRDLDWPATPLGPAERWPQSLKSAVDLCLGSGLPSFVWWGPRLVQLYNDPALAVLGARHPAALGTPAAEVWAEIWPEIGAFALAVLRSGEPVLKQDVLLTPARAQPCAMSFAALRDEAGEVAGVFVSASDGGAGSRAEASLRASQARFRLAEEAAHVFVYDWDLSANSSPHGGGSGPNTPSDLRTALDRVAPWCSDGVTVVLGYPQGEAPRSRAAWQALIHPDDRTRVSNALEEGVRVGRYSVEYRLRHKDGRYVDVLDPGLVVRDEPTGIQRIIGAVVDLTERRRAEAELRTSEERLRLATSAARMVTFELDLATGAVRFDSNVLAVLYGRADEPVQDLDWRALAHDWLQPEDAKRHGELLAATARGEGDLHNELLVRHPITGAETWIEAEATLVGDGPRRIVGIMRNIDRRKRAGEALRTSEARLRRILDTETVGVVFFDSATGAVLEANDAFWAMTGYGAADLQDGGLTWRMMTPPEWVPASEAQLGVLAATGRIGPYEKEYWRKDGTRIWMLFVGRDLGDGTLVEFALNIDERKRLEAERERLLVTEAAAAERAALLKRIVQAQEEERAKVARDVHDSVTQLAHAAAIHLDNALDLLDGSPARSEVERGRDLARQTATEARRLIAGLRPETLDTFGLSAALEQEVESLRAAGWRVDFEAGGLDGTRLEPEAEMTLFRVAQEALSNVRKHAPRARVGVRLQRQDGTVWLEVRDSGPGFAASKPQPTIRGEHLGLVGMRERMQVVGGTLELRTRPNGGTTIRAVLPVNNVAAR